jgi:hypothetical protein
MTGSGAGAGLGVGGWAGRGRADGTAVGAAGSPGLIIGIGSVRPVLPGRSARSSSE